MNYLIARVSDPSQIDALPAQKMRLLNYAKERGWVLGKDCTYVEFDETAYKDTRKKFNELVMQPLLAAGGLSIAVFDKIDRFSRDSTSDERAAFTKLWKQGRLEMHFPSDNLFIHRNSPAADLFRLDIGVALAGYYSSAIRDNVKRKFEQKLADGEWPGKAPIGYLNVVVGKDAKGNDIRSIEPDPIRGKYIVEGYELRAAGLSYKAIALKLKGKLVSNTKLTKNITAGQWEAILDNPFYKGVMRYNGKTYPHKYGAIVQPWLWDKVQKVNEQRSTGRTNYIGKQFIFKTLRCDVCGYSISFDGPKHNGGIYGKCTEYGGKHGAKWIDERLLLDQFKDLLKSIKIPKEVMPDIITEIQKNHASEQQFYKQNRTRLQKEYNKCDKDVEQLFRDRKQFKSRPDIFEKLVKEVEDRQKFILQELEDHSNGDKAFVIGASYILELCSRGAELFEAQSTEIDQKRFLVNFLLPNVKLRDQELVFTLLEPFPAIQQMVKTNSWLRGQDSDLRPRR